MSRLQVLTEMVKEFQCPGCPAGSDPKTCSAFKLKEEAHGACCTSHVAGTYAFGIGHIILGLPKGFNRTQRQMQVTDGVREMKTTSLPDIRLHADNSTVRFDKLNVPVWAMERDGYLFVRSFSPRIDHSGIEVIKGGKREELAPAAFNVADFYDDID